MRIGVVSDTHGKVDPALAALFAGVDAIVHAGDVVGAGVLEALALIAPLRAVRGNNDEGPWAEALPAARVERFAGVPVLVVHILPSVEAPSLAVQFLLQAEKPKVVVTGHSHAPLLVLKDGILFFNPGSAGPARFKVKPSAGLLTLTEKGMHAELYALEAGKPRKTSELIVTAP